MKNVKAVFLGTCDTLLDHRVWNPLLNITIVSHMKKRIQGNKKKPGFLMARKRKKISKRSEHVLSEKVNPLPVIQRPVLCEYVIQEHIPDHPGPKAPPHWDLRVHINGEDHSFAIPRMKLPSKGHSIQAIKQPEHTKEYYDFQGQITDGKGQGLVKILYRGYCEISPGNSDATAFVARFWDNEIAGHYAFLHVNERKSTSNVLIIRKRDPAVVPIKKMSFSSKAKDDVWDDPNIRAERKRDGAHNHIVVTKEGKPYIVSHRTSVKDGGTIYIEDKVPHLREVAKKLPPDSVLAVEIYHPKKTAAFVGGVLNSLPPRARFTQLKQGKLHAMVFDIRRWEGNDYTEIPYRQKLEIMKQIKKITGGKIEIPPGTTRSKRKYYEKIVSRPAEGRSRGEGVVLKHLDKPVRYGRSDEDLNTSSPDWIKVKDSNTWDKVIVGLIPGEGRFANCGIGAILYGDSPDGPVIGRCGSGITDKQRKDMFENPEKFIGQVVEIAAETESPKTGTLLKPRFVRLRTDKDPNDPSDITVFKPEDIDLEERVRGMGLEGDSANRTKYAMKSARGWKKK